MLRTLDECLALRAELEKASRLCVVGAGFIGAEVAASARVLGVEVTVLEALPAPLARAFPRNWGPPAPGSISIRASTSAVASPWPASRAGAHWSRE